jgi:hypothetical protein
VRRLVGIGGVVLLLILVFGVGQLVLPGIAASMLKSRLSKDGHVVSVSVSAFPAIELLWHDADKVVVRMTDYHSSAGHLSSQLDQASGVGTLDVSAQRVEAGSLVVRNVRLTKRGNRLSGSADVTETALRDAYPILDSVGFVSSGNGSLVLRGTATVVLVTGSIDVTVHADDGKLVVTPGGLFGLFAFTVFSDPHIEIEGVSGAPTAGGLSLSATGQFR